MQLEIIMNYIDLNNIIPQYLKSRSGSGDCEFAIFYSYKEVLLFTLNAQLISPRIPFKVNGMLVLKMNLLLWY